MEVNVIRRNIIKKLEDEGFVIDSNGKIQISNMNKDDIRRLYEKPRQKRLEEEKLFIAKNIDKLSNYFANGDQIDINKIAPKIIELNKHSKEYADLFRLASMLWSVPVSRGYGRRLRFIVIDENVNKLIGIFALKDPVFNLAVRDSVIGWSHEERAMKLYNVMDIYVLGAVPPYSRIVCGKLIAMLAASNEVRKIVANKYMNSVTKITHEKKDPRVVLLTTSSALGRSSIYNRIVYEGSHMYTRVGVTKGWGHFHFSNGTYELIKNYLLSINHPIVRGHQYGKGPNWKIRMIRIGLEKLGLSQELLKHGIKREVYFCPLAQNYNEYLTGRTKQINFLDYPMNSLFEYFNERWLSPRALRCRDYKDIRKENYLDELYAVRNLDCRVGE